jgi:hypothetical protein
MQSCNRACNSCNRELSAVSYEVWNAVVERIYIYVSIYLYIGVSSCVCVCVCRSKWRGEENKEAETWRGGLKLASGISRERARIWRGAPRRVVTGLGRRSVLG